MSLLSLYLPIISANVSEAYIIKMFDMQKIGKVKRVDFVKNKAKVRCEAFVHFSEWYTTPESTLLHSDIINPITKTKFLYNNTAKFWPLLINKNPFKKIANNEHYEVLKKEDVLVTYKSTLNIHNQNHNQNQNQNQMSMAKKLKSANQQLIQLN
jgi:hypothetical protein